MAAGFYRLVFLVGGTYGDGFRFVIREPIMGLAAACCLWLAAQLEFRYESIFGKLIQHVARNEYGIYLWHMILLGCVSVSPAYILCTEKCPVLLLLVMIVLTIAVGTISSKCVESDSYRQIFKKILRMEKNR